MAPKILISAGEASGDLYAASLAEALRRRYPEAGFFGCVGPRMRAAGVEAVADMARLAVVGLVEVLSHIPRIYSEFRKIHRAAEERRPDLAILTDSPDFHLRLAPRLRKLGVPVVYLVAPQAWAWRKGRVHTLRRNVERLLCIFPFEESFFRAHGVAAVYIGHPLARLVRASCDKEKFFEKNGLQPGRKLVTLLPGSRPGEVARHLPDLRGAVRLILERRRDVEFALATPLGHSPASVGAAFPGLPVRIVEGQTWDAVASSDLALAASGTVTIETALLGTPMVTFYRVSRASWRLGRPFVNVPFYSMVNLVAERRVVPELIQNHLTPERLASEALELLENAAARERMKEDLAEVAGKLRTGHDPMEWAADEVQAVWKRK
ncbi:MAG: lipid-A-disaccharide synthase [Acidobacteria bacterium]|nr:lipid-A-disaccharide synthase [Acidobacteriota bacterium]